MNSMIRATLVQRLQEMQREVAGGLGVVPPVPLVVEGVMGKEMEMW